ncbi:MAG: hypothetical protein JST00_00590 [Deltaproteobacteria bacterium]|nr:hypothetical protein [Deltaproteobacteria bacterium]
MTTRHKLALRMFLVAATLGAVTLFGATRARAREANQAQLATGFSAKETCSCAFAAEQSDDYCREFGTPAGIQVEIAIDRKAKTATSTFLGVARTARFTDGQGCLLDPLP